ncbi:unnamed protein product [Vitrella brassicaformis CCMP3155]|uniref:F-BAR domain-containing protein n=5 Tax=Vitrella brassicaformis TaxID=1169539 RepID=A0A0G4G8D1_VITBC|nr:unnamed protein product [Vitrella brassicaformis CCMP3155]|eukprot:CEM25142.1 unnamed protein product [Vitrella brassicaformis CCMP3155]
MESSDAAEPERTFKTDLWDGFECVCKKVESGRRLCETFLTIMRDRMALEDTYAAGMERLAAKCPKHINEGSTVLRAIGCFRNEAIRKAEQSRELAEGIRDDIVQQLQETVKNHQTVFKKIYSDGVKFIKLMNGHIQTHERAMLRYEKTCREADATCMNAQASDRSPPPLKTKLAIKALQLCKEAQIAEEQYRHALDALNNGRRTFRHQMTVVLDALQDMEEKRIQCFKDALRKLMVYQTSYVRNIQYDLDITIEGVEAIDPRAEICEYIDKVASGRQPPHDSNMLPWPVITEWRVRKAGGDLLAAGVAPSTLPSSMKHLLAPPVPSPPIPTTTTPPVGTQTPAVDPHTTQTDANAAPDAASEAFSDLADPATKPKPAEEGDEPQDQQQQPRQHPQDPAVDHSTACDDSAAVSAEADSHHGAGESGAGREDGGGISSASPAPPPPPPASEVPNHVAVPPPPPPRPQQGAPAAAAAAVGGVERPSVFPANFNPAATANMLRHITRTTGLDRLADSAAALGGGVGRVGGVQQGEGAVETIPDTLIMDTEIQYNAVVDSIWADKGMTVVGLRPDRLVNDLQSALKRALLITAISKKRIDKKFQLPSRIALKELAMVCQPLLDWSDRQFDVACGRTLMVLSQFFYCIDQPTPESTHSQHTPEAGEVDGLPDSDKGADAGGEDKGESAGEPSASTSTSSSGVSSPEVDKGGEQPRKVFLQTLLYHHGLWNRVQFWEEALVLFLSEEMQKNMLSRRWRTRTSEERELEDKNFRDHNPCAGMLYSFGKSMVSFGIGRPAVRDLITKVCLNYDVAPEVLTKLLEGLEDVVVPADSVPKTMSGQPSDMAPKPADAGDVTAMGEEQGTSTQQTTENHDLVTLEEAEGQLSLSASDSHVFEA